MALIVSTILSKEPHQIFYQHTTPKQTTGKEEQKKDTLPRVQPRACGDESGTSVAFSHRCELNERANE